MSKVKAWSITDQNVVVNYDGETHIVRRTDALADRLIKALKEGREKEIPALVSTAKRIQTFSKGAFVVENGRVVVNGVPAPQVLSDKIVRFSNDGLPFQPLLRFAEKLQANPSFRAVNELYQFLEKNDHPITEHGNFIAYKRVKGNFTDIYTGKFDNSVGKLVEISRNQVDEDSSRTCSYGLHVANWDYAHTQYGTQGPDTTDIMLEVEVSPADVVAIPSDYNQSKMRVCRYKVLGVVTTPFDPETSLRVVDQDKFNQDVADLGEEEEESYCEYCGVETYNDDALCSECVYDEECCEDCGGHECDGACCSCEDCGAVISPGAGTCDECDEEDDKYPYEDELK